MKRKSLLVAMASVSLAAIGVGATSTFAWFSSSATANLSVTGPANTAAYSVTYESFGDALAGIPVTVSFEELESTSGKDLILSHPGQISGEGVANAWNHAHKAGNNVYVNAVDPSKTDGTYHGEYGKVTNGNYTDYKLFKVVASYTATQDQIDAFQGASTKTITFTATLGDASTSAKMFEASISNNALALPTTFGDVAITINMASITATSTAATVEGDKIIGVYFEGTDVASNASQSAKVVKKTN